MNYYLIDASAFIYAVENLDRIKRNFFIEKAGGIAFLYMPQFCVTEVLNTYAKFFWRLGRIGLDRYNKWRDEFIKAIQNRTIIYCYDLHRYHNLNADEIYELEHRTPYMEEEKRLSSLDILVIAMGMELKRVHCSDNVLILTRDRRLLKISNMKEGFAQAVWFK
jgi:hypothetical protein